MYTSALITDKGNIFTALNRTSENGFGESGCSERVVADQAAMNNETHFTAIVTVSLADRSITMPCESCCKYLSKLDPQNSYCEVMTSESTSVMLKEYMSQMGYVLDAAEIFGDDMFSGFDTPATPPPPVQTINSEPDQFAAPPSQNDMDNGQPVYPNPDPMAGGQPMYQNGMAGGQPMYQNPMMNGQPMYQNPGMNGQPMYQNPMMNGQPMYQNPMMNGQPMYPNGVVNGQNPYQSAAPFPNGNMNGYPNSASSIYINPTANTQENSPSASATNLPENPDDSAQNNVYQQKLKSFLNISDSPLHVSSPAEEPATPPPDDPTSADASKNPKNVKQMKKELAKAKKAAKKGLFS